MKLSTVGIDIFFRKVQLHSISEAKFNNSRNLAISLENPAHLLHGNLREASLSEDQIGHCFRSDKSSLPLRKVLV
jgi:hypothetical protein